MALVQTIRLAAWAVVAVVVFSGTAAADDAGPRLADGGSLERQVSTGVDDHIDIDVGSTPLVVVVDQNGIDLSLRIDGDANLRNAPTGRWGRELVVVDRSGPLLVRARGAGVVNARYRVQAFSLRSREGLRFPELAWRWWAQAYYDAGTEKVEGYARAIDGLRVVAAALALAKDGGESLREAQLGIANLLRRSRRHDEAIAAYDAMLATLDARTWPAWVMRASNGKGLSLRDRADFEQADAAFERAAQIGDAGHDPYEWVSARNNRCLIQHHFGRLEQARDCYSAVIPDYRKVAPEQVAVPLLNLAAAASALGDATLALENYRAALDLRRAGTDRTSLGIVLTNLSVFEARTGAWPDALAHSLEAQDVFESIGNESLLAGVLLVRGWIYDNLREPVRAREYFNRSLAMARKTGDDGGIAAARSVLAERDSDDVAAAAEHRAAIAWYEKTRQSEWEVDERLELARRLDATGDAAGRDAELTRIDALLAAGASGVQRARMAMLRATVATRAGRDADALAQVDEAIALRALARQPDGLAAARLARARLERRGGRDEPALVEIERALAELAQAERLPGSPVLAANLIDRRAELIEEATDLVLGAEPDDAALTRAWALRWTFTPSPHAGPAVPLDAAQRELLAELRVKVMLLAGAPTPRVSTPAKPRTPEDDAVLARRIEAIESELDARASRAAAATARVALTPAALASALESGEALVALALGERRSGAFVIAAQKTRWVALPAKSTLDAATAAAVARPNAKTLAALSRALAPRADRARRRIAPDSVRGAQRRRWALLGRAPQRHAAGRPAVVAGTAAPRRGAGRLSGGHVGIGRRDAGAHDRGRHDVSLRRGARPAAGRVGRAVADRGDARAVARAHRRRVRAGRRARGAELGAARGRARHRERRTPERLAAGAARRRGRRVHAARRWRCGSWESAASSRFSECLRRRGRAHISDAGAVVARE